MSAAAKLAWAKFYFGDWRSDPCLRMCSLAARGLWMEMLGIMHEAQPYGYLVIRGVVPTTGQLASIAGASEAEVATLLDELKRNGVYSLNRADVIYSRRMVRDAKKASTARENGKAGGNPKLLEKRYEGDKSEKTGQISENNDEIDHDLNASTETNNPASDNQTETDPLKGRHNTQRLETRDYKEESKEGRVTPPPPLADGEQPKPDEPKPSPAVTSPSTGEGEAPQPDDKPPKPAKPPPPNHAPEMFAIWRQRFGSRWPKLILDDKRTKTLNLRLADSFGKDIAKWSEFCDLVLTIPFLNGELVGKPWRANLDWITGPKHIQDIREGKYDHSNGEGYPTHANGAATRRIPHETLLTGFAEAARDHRNKAKV